MAIFTYCLSHELNFAIEASIQSVACNRVLLILDESSFGFKRTDVLSCSIPTAASDTRWNDKSRQLVHIVQKEMPKWIRDDTTQGRVWNPATQASATLFVTHLESADFMFVEKLLNRAFQITDIYCTPSCRASV